MSRIPMNDEDRTHPGQQQFDEDALRPDAPDAPGGEPGNDLLKLQAERDDLYQRLARAQADYQNSRRRLESETDQRVQYANSSLIKALLPVIDNFERALAVDVERTDAGSILKGMQIVHDQLMKVLGEQHVEEIAPEPGTPFDPGRHEALIQQPDAEHPEPVVTQLFRKGYALRDRTLRPAQVAVSKTS